jgi:hypothetical protein
MNMFLGRWGKGKSRQKRGRDSIFLYTPQALDKVSKNRNCMLMEETVSDVDTNPNQNDSVKYWTTAMTHGKNGKKLMAWLSHAKIAQSSSQFELILQQSGKRSSRKVGHARRVTSSFSTSTSKSSSTSSSSSSQQDT